jgi:hypothetical protein
MTKQNLTKEQRENILKANILISGNFNWKDTKEGSEYWYKVCNALDRISESNQKEFEEYIDSEKIESDELKEQYYLGCKNGYEKAMREILFNVNERIIDVNESYFKYKIN